MKPTIIFEHYLVQLDTLLDKINQADPSALNARLAEDMFPLLQQAKIAIGFSLRACCPIARRDIVSFSEEELNLNSVKQELNKALTYLQSIPENAFDDFATLSIKTRAGFADLELSGEDYYYNYCLPNFFFHFNTVYAIARNQGLALSKGDFDGYHTYPDGFNFESA